MSEKKAKEKRRAEAAAAEEAAKPIGTITIDVFSDMNVNVVNFPSDPNVALMIMCNAIMKVSAYFLQQATVNKSNLLLARPGASQADILKMAAGN